MLEHSVDIATKLSEWGEKWLWDHATQFARWQHPAVGEARFAVTGISCYIVCYYLLFFLLC